MKADLTRDTFHPLKHYSRVLTQQGRVQLDADMNEQAAILLRYLQTLAADLIGPAGGPDSNLGFAITALPGATPNPPDFQIGFGNYYVNGLLCQADFTPIAFFPTTAPNATVFQVINWSPDFDLQPIPYFYEIFDADPTKTTPPTSPPAPLLVKIMASDKMQNRITLTTAPDYSNFNNPKLRRFITYLHQPDYPLPPNPASPLALPPPFPTNLQIYLDVWERVITYAEDDSIREVALGGPDTTARSKLVWQVKWMRTTAEADGPCITPPSLGPRGWLQAMAKQSSQSTNPCIINPNASYSGPENQLYRVEINRSGNAGTVSGTSATFKWSRENGSVIYPIVSGGGTSAVVVESLGRDDRFGLAEGNLVEVQDDRSVLLNQPGNLQTVQMIDRTTMTVTLGAAPNPPVGDDEALHPLLRRWDQTNGDPAEFGLTLDTDNCAFVQEGVWLALEDGVQIQFQPTSLVPAPAGTNAQPNFYLTSDYWLIPARTATGDVEWPKITDAQGIVTPVALPPHGVTHYYAPLAVISVEAGGVVSVLRTKCRNKFALPLTQV